MTFALIIGLLFLLRFWKFFTLKLRLILLGTIGLLFNVSTKLSYELEVINQHEGDAIAAIFLVALPSWLFRKSFRTRRLWLEILSLAVCIPSILFWILWVWYTISFPNQLIAKFDSSDGFVYVVREVEYISFGSDGFCRSLHQYKRVFPGILSYQKSFYGDEENRCFEEVVGSHELTPIEEVKRRFRAKE